MNWARAYAIYLLINWTTVKAVTLHRNQQKDSLQNVTRQEHPRESLLDETKRATMRGYLASEHTVQTEDGYVLRLSQIRRTGEDIKGPPVLLMHGLLMSAASWIDAGPDAALAYLLADAGHDVWLGNVRGTHSSRTHAWLNPDTDSQYWQFCVDEIGRYDLPASIDYILSRTGAQMLNYIGYSQGGGTFFIMCAERPEYREKINVMIALAPATRMLHTKSFFFRFITEYYDKTEKELTQYDIWEVTPKGGFLQSLFQVFCALSDRATEVCEITKDLLDAPNPGSITKSTIRALTASFPAGTSVHNMAYFGQSVNVNNFYKFDYGSEKNLVLYGTASPPVYNLSSVTVPTVVVYGRNDGIVDIRDVKWLVGKLPNVLEDLEVKDPLWSHYDMTHSRHIPKLLFPKIIKYLNKKGIKN